MASSSGSWGDEPPATPPAEVQKVKAPAWAHAIEDYIAAIPGYVKSLPGRALVGFGAEGQRLADLGKAGPKEQARDMFAVGHGVDAYDAGKEGRYGAAAGNALLALADAAGPARSKAVSAADAALSAWSTATKARPGQVADELARLTTPRMKPNTAAAARREAAAEGAIPRPQTPGGIATEEAARRLDVASRTWPGNVGAGLGTAAGASGIPGVIVDDAMDAADSDRALKREMGRDMSNQSMDRKAPFRPDAAPEAAFYGKQRDEAARARNINLGYAGAESAGGIGGAYGAMKTVPWAARNAGPAAIGLGSELAIRMAAEHPLLALAGLPFMAAGALPFAVPGALGYGSWKAAQGTADNVEHALKQHDRVKLLDKLMDNYREQPNPMSINPPSGDY